jgi:hypothetical protein
LICRKFDNKVEKHKLVNFAELEYYEEWFFVLSRTLRIIVNKKKSDYIDEVFHTPLMTVTSPMYLMYLCVFLNKVHVFYWNCILGLFSSNTLFVIRVNSSRCLLYWQPFLLYRSDNQVNECPHWELSLIWRPPFRILVHFARLQKRRATASVFMSVSESVCTRGVSGSYQTGFRETSYLEFVLDCVDTFRYSLKAWQAHYGKTYLHCCDVFITEIVFTVKYEPSPYTQLTI